MQANEQTEERVAQFLRLAVERGLTWPRLDVRVVVWMVKFHPLYFSLFRMAPEVAAVERKGRLKDLCILSCLR